MYKCELEGRIQANLFFVDDFLKTWMSVLVELIVAICSFYDFTMDETKRKYKWEAYSEQEKKWWIDTLTFIGERLAGKSTH